VQEAIDITEEFCEHERSDCPFCGKGLLFGHEPDQEMTLIHELPPCEVWKQCGSIDEFTVITVMHQRATDGQVLGNN
jgi:hypothetical protein